MATVADALASMARNIEEKTGTSVAVWVARCRATGYSRHGEVLGWLKEQHGIGHGYANFLAKEALKAEVEPEDPLADMFAGSKAALRPVYDRIVAYVVSLGTDVELAPKKNNVSLRRRRQFALLQPSTATRLDVGLILPGVACTDRLEQSASFNAMFTHRVRVGSVSDIDAPLKQWLKAAYGGAG